MYRNQKAVEMEKLLAASGFKMRLADTQGKVAQLKELPQRKLVAQNWDVCRFFHYSYFIEKSVIQCLLWKDYKQCSLFGDNRNSVANGKEVRFFRIQFPEACL